MADSENTHLKSILADFHGNLKDTQESFAILDGWGIPREERYANGDLIGHNTNADETKKCLDLVRRLVPSQNITGGNNEWMFIGTVPLIGGPKAVGGTDSEVIQSFIAYMNGWLGLSEDEQDPDMNMRFLGRVFKTRFTNIDPIETLEASKPTRKTYITIDVDDDEIVSTPGGRKISKPLEELRQSTPTADVSWHESVNIDKKIAEIQRIRREWVDPNGTSYWEFFGNLKETVDFTVKHKSGKDVQVTIVHGDPRYTSPDNVRSQFYIVPGEFIETYVLPKIEADLAKTAMTPKDIERATLKSLIYVPVEAFTQNKWVKGPHIFYLSHSHYAFKHAAVVDGEPVIFVGTGAAGKYSRFDQKRSCGILDLEADTVEEMAYFAELKNGPLERGCE